MFLLFAQGQRFIGARATPAIADEAGIKSATVPVEVVRKGAKRVGIFSRVKMQEKFLAKRWSLLIEYSSGEGKKFQRPSIYS